MRHQPIEVLSIVNKLPADFGLVSFPIIRDIDFLITVVDRDEDRLLSAKLILSSATYSQVQQLDTIVNNMVTIKDSIGLISYTLIVQKNGYQTYSQVYSIDSLAAFNNNGNHSPLLIELEKNSSNGIVTDIEGNIYHTVAIETQVWLLENLRSTKLNDGTAIQNVTYASVWTALNTPAYCWYNNDTASKTSYGSLYNGYAVKTGKLCPHGWHVPTYDEWSTLITFLGGHNVAGSKLKEIGTMHWSDPNNGADNSSGFTALPGGVRLPNISFYGRGSYGLWWSSSEIIETRGIWFAK